MPFRLLQKMFPTLGVGLATGALLVAGCDAPASSMVAGKHEHEHEHEHARRPDSFHAAVKQLKAYRESIRTAIETNHPEDAHDSLHKVAELLDSLPDVAADTDLPKAEWQAVNAASDQLFDAFGVVDMAFHKKDGDKKAAYDKVASDIDEAIQELEFRLPLTGEETPSGPADDHRRDNGEEVAPGTESGAAR